MDNIVPYYAISHHIGPFWITFYLKGQVVSYAGQFWTIFKASALWPPLPEVGCPIFLEIWNPWGKVMEISGLRFEPFCLKIVKNCAQKKKVFLLILPYKAWWKPRFPMD